MAVAGQARWWGWSSSLASSRVHPCCPRSILGPVAGGALGAEGEQGPAGQRAPFLPARPPLKILPVSTPQPPRAACPGFPARPCAMGRGAGRLGEPGTTGWAGEPVGCEGMRLSWVSSSGSNQQLRFPCWKSVSHSPGTGLKQRRKNKIS